ncbi:MULTISPECIES: molybdenum cofactor guanylyltransferase [Paenibacillus]|nr:molybdenum cofactor guanylyltransferase [Paenibacillus sp. TCA20]
MRFSGIILAGGLSSRMGTDKALLPLGEANVIQVIASELAGAVDDVRIAVGKGYREEYAELGYTQAADVYPGCGPLAGLHAGLTAHRGASSSGEGGWSLSVPCDTPLVRTELFKVLIQYAELQENSCYQAIVPVIEGQTHPLIALYHDCVIPVLEQQLETGRRRVMDFLSQISVRYVTEHELAADAGMPWTVSDISEMFTNMNQMEDYERIKKRCCQ